MIRDSEGETLTERQHGGTGPLGLPGLQQGREGSPCAPYGWVKT